MKHILELIENVDPSDTAKLDEIDARVWCFKYERTYQKNTTTKTFGKPRVKYAENPYPQPYDRYTRSRDALKAIRPEGWKAWVIFAGYEDGTKARGEMFEPDGRSNKIIQTDWLPTEELAELHAIIQAIAYERGQK